MRATALGLAARAQLVLQLVTAQLVTVEIDWAAIVNGERWCSEEECCAELVPPAVSALTNAEGAAGSATYSSKSAHFWFFANES